MATKDNSMDDQFIFDDDLDMSIDSNPENCSKEERAKKLIEENLKMCSIHDLEEKILKIACPVLKDNLIEIIDQIENKLGEDKTKSTRIFDDLFIKCQSALEPWNELMNHVQKLGNSCESTKLKSLIDNLPNVVIKISGHCKSKRQQYPKEQLPPLLSDVFRKSCTIVKTFCNLLSSIIIFSHQDDLEGLKKIISEIGEIARLSTYDLVTMGQSWKTFMKLACTHKDVLNTEDSINTVRSHFKHLTNIINSLYNNIIKSSVELFEKRAKCTVFLITILDRLHMVFFKNHSPNEEFIREMIPHLINLCANHVMCTGARLKDHEKSLYKARAKNITSNFAESAIAHYTSLNDFWKILLEEFEEVKKKKDLKYAIGYHFMILLTIEKWKPADSFFQIAIENINYFQEEILMGSLDFSALNNESKSVYSSTLSVLINFLIERVDDFENYERIVLKNLMKESLWPSLMAHDILQQLYKVSSEELPMTHIKHFMRAYEALKDRDDSFAVVMLTRLIIDIYKLLSNESKEQVIKNCNSPGSCLLILKSESSDEFIRGKQLALYRKITAVESVSSLSEIMADLRRQPTVKNWNRMVEVLKLMGILKERTSRSNTENLCEISSFIMNAVEESTGWRRKMLLDIMMLLFDCAEIDAEDNSFNWTLISVLFSRVSHTLDLPIDFLIKLCHYLTANAHRLNSTSEENIPVLSNLICFLLEHENDFVRQEGLEAYDHIVEMCKNDDLVRKITRIIAQRPKLREIVPAYLKKEILEEIPNISDYLKTLSKRTIEFSIIHPHKCCEEEEEPEHDDKRFKSDNGELEEKVESICEGLRIISNEKSNVDPRMIEKLKNACCIFLNEH